MPRQLHQGRRTITRTVSALIAMILILAGAVPAASAASDAPVTLSKVSSAGTVRTSGAGARAGGDKGTTVRAGVTRAMTLPSRTGTNIKNAPVIVQVTVTGARKSGTLTLWTAGRARPKVPQVRFAKGVSSTTVLLVTDARGRISLRSSQGARVSIDVLGRFQGGASVKPAPGGTRVVAPSVVVDRGASRGAWPTRTGHEVKVPVLGVGAVPASGVRAVWVSVQARATKPGSLSFRASGSGSLVKGAAAFGPTWSTSLVLAPVEDDGTIRVRASGSVPKDLRVLVEGWVAEQTSLQASSTATHGIVLTAEQNLSPRLTSSAAGRRVYRIPTGRQGVANAAREVVVALRLTSTRAGDVRVGATSRALSSPSAMRTQVEAGQSSRVVMVVPVRSGATYLSVPGGTRVVSATVQGYLGTTASRTSDRTAPTLKITSHRDRERVDGATTPRITFAGTVVDRGSGVRRIEILGDGVRLGAATIDTSRRTSRWTFETAVPDGTHRLTARAVDRAGRTTSRSIRITSVAPAASATVVGPDVEVLPASLTRNVARVDAASVTITGTASSVEVGDVIVAGATPTTPEGLARRVVAVELVSGTTVLRTRQAELTEIFEQADVSVRGVAVAEDVAGPRSSAGSAGLAVDAMSVTQSLTTKGTVDLVKLAQPEESASGRVKATLVYSVEATVTADIDLEIAPKRRGFWFTPSIQHFSIAFTLTNKTSTTLTGSLTTAGINKFLTWDQVFSSRLMRPVNIQAGPVPIVLVPSFEVAGVGSVSFSGGFSTGYTVTSTDRLGVGYDENGVYPIKENTNAIAGKTTFEAAVNAKAGLEVRIPTRLYGVAGPFVKVSVVGDASQSVSTTGTTRKVGVSMVVGVGADVSILGKKLGKFQQDWTLFRKPLGDEFIPFATPTPSPSTSATSEPGPSATATPVPSASPSSDPPLEPSPEPTEEPTVPTKGLVVEWSDSASSDPEAVVRVGVPLDVAGIGNVGDLAAHINRAVAASDDGSVWAWGDNRWGSLGIDGDEELSAPTRVPGLSGVVAVATTAHAAYALHRNGSITSWGLRINGNLGDGVLYGESRGMVRVKGLDDVVEIAAGHFAGYALRGDGTVWAWGQGTRGELGLGIDVQFAYEPQRVPGLENIVEVSALGSVVVARDDSGAVWQWGTNQSGIPEDEQIDWTPTPVPGLPEIVDVGVAYYSTFAVDSNGNVWTWGYSFDASIEGSLTAETKPSRVEGLPAVHSVWTSWYAAFVADADGNLWGWGAMNGVPHWGNTPTRLYPSGGVKKIVGGAATAYGLVDR